jgi:hypothetical protein
MPKSDAQLGVGSLGIRDLDRQIRALAAPLSVEPAGIEPATSCCKDASTRVTDQRRLRLRFVGSAEPPRPGVAFCSCH